jgi:hypothetical protein
VFTPRKKSQFLVSFDGSWGSFLGKTLMSRNGWQQLGDDAASVAPSKGVSDISGIELGSALGEQHQVRSGRYMSRARVPS